MGKGDVLEGTICKLIASLDIENYVLQWVPELVEQIHDLPPYNLLHQNKKLYMFHMIIHKHLEVV